MHWPHSSLRRVFVFACVVPFATLFAQANPVTAPAGATASASRGSSGALKALNLEDYGRWQRISGTAISPDGKWMMYTLTPNEGGGPTLHVKPIDGGNEITIPLGGGRGGGAGGGRGGRGGAAGGGGGGTAPAFSDDSRWVVYSVTPSGGRGAGAGGRGPAAGGTPPQPGGRGQPTGAAQPPAPATRLELRSLATGTVEKTFTGVAAARFSPRSRYLMLRMSRPQGAPTTLTSADLVLHDLATGVDRNIGNVAQYEFNDEGKFLAYTIQAPEKLGNGVYLLDAASGVTHTLVTASADFDAMAWNSAGTGLSALRGDKPDGMKHRNNVLLAWSGLGAGTPTPFTYDPTNEASFPEGFVLSEYSAPRWSNDGSRFFIGIKEQEEEIAAADSNKQTSTSGTGGISRLSPCRYDR